MRWDGSIDFIERLRAAVFNLFRLFQLAIKMSVVIAATTALYFYIVATDQQWIKILGFYAFWSCGSVRSL